MMNYEASDVDVRTFEAVRPELANSVCTSKEMKFFIDNDVPVKFSYYGKDGMHVATITIQPSECKNN